MTTQREIKEFSSFQLDCFERGLSYFLKRGRSKNYIHEFMSLLVKKLKLFKYGSEYDKFSDYCLLRKVENYYIKLCRNKHAVLRDYYYDELRAFNYFFSIEYRRLSLQHGSLKEQSDALDIKNKYDKDKFIHMTYYSLERQCNALNIKLLKFPCKSDRRPEQDAIDFLKNQDYRVYSGESGPIFSVLKAMILEDLQQYNNNGPEDVYCRYFEALITIMDSKTNADKIFNQFASKIHSVSISKIIENYNKITASDFFQSGLAMDDIFVEQLVNLLSREKLLKILYFLKENPFVNTIGWPDLTVIKDSEFYLVEVKKNDKLIKSQLRTIPRLINECAINCQVAQIISA